ncbi:hypothetical protein BD311DRAFT_812733 [Dichomitus squalens]|uniref:Uncharacterized protein n=1 Tax=Dichomitus squalens TaxID=114155 RepID=A0A4Q9M4W9_9APHY|nr:hypothetical protein BD311DRAFT_812733 [Dichomitus squalens]
MHAARKRVLDLRDVNWYGPHKYIAGIGTRTYFGESLTPFRVQLPTAWLPDLATQELLPEPYFTYAHLVFPILHDRTVMDDFRNGKMSASSPLLRRRVPHFHVIPAQAVEVTHADPPPARDVLPRSTLLPARHGAPPDDGSMQPLATTPATRSFSSATPQRVPTAVVISELQVLVLRHAFALPSRSSLLRPPL